MPNIPPSQSNTLQPAEDETYLIIGLGITGLSVAHYLHRQGINFAVADTRLNPPGLQELRRLWPQVSIWLGPLDAELTCTASCLVVSPGVSLAEPALALAKQQGVEIIGDIELFARHLHSLERPLLAITGSNAKSTVTSLLGQMVTAAGLKVGVGGNIGRPALDLLTEEIKDIYVLELSSFQLETTQSLNALGASLLNISEDHLDRYPSFTEYIFAKQRIFHHCSVTVYNRDDPQTLPIHGLNAQQLSFGLGQPQAENELGLAELATGTWLVHGNQPLMPAQEVNLAGQHGLLNVMAAYALGLAAGLPNQAMRKAVIAFQGLEHRCQLVAQRRGVKFYNDSKATNIGALLAALGGLATPATPTWLILGGEAKGQDFTPLQTALTKNIAGVALIGRDASLIAEYLPQQLTHQFCSDLQQAVHWLAQQAGPGELVLLSPACASLDMFSSFAERGEVFIQCVRNLPE